MTIVVTCVVCSSILTIHRNDDLPSHNQPIAQYFSNTSTAASGTIYNLNELTTS